MTAPLRSAGALGARRMRADGPAPRPPCVSGLALASLLWVVGAPAPAGGQSFGAAARTDLLGDFGFREFVTFRLANRIRRNGDKIPDPLDRRTATIRNTILIAFRPADRFSLVAAVPWERTRFAWTFEDRRLESETSGIGDVLLLGAARVTGDRAAGRPSLTVQVGVELPTGRGILRDDRGLILPIPFYSGTESTKILTDLVAAWTPGGESGRWRLGGDVGYTVRTEDGEFDPGDGFRYDLSAGYRVWPSRAAGGSRSVTLQLEANGIVDRRHEEGDIEPKLSNSGGEELYLAPGLLVTLGRGLTLEAATQLPVLQELNGFQSAGRFNALFGLRYAVRR